MNNKTPPMQPNKVIAFDVYGTLLDTNGVIVLLQQYIGDNAPNFAKLWREKQLEYSFRRGLMQCYKSFAVCTAQALDYCIAVFGVSLSTSQKNDLLSCYNHLPAFNDVQDALPTLQNKGYTLYALSNGQASDVQTALTNAGIRQYLRDIISVESVQSFKPSPLVYKHFIDITQASCAWLVSSNSFDIIGAVHAGMSAVWIRRQENTVFDPWEISPTLTVNSIAAFANQLPSPATV